LSDTANTWVMKADAQYELVAEATTNVDAHQVLMRKYGLIA
jgi:hypothetical protein